MKSRVSTATALVLAITAGLADALAEESASAKNVDVQIVAVLEHVYMVESFKVWQPGNKQGKPPKVFVNEKPEHLYLSMNCLVSSIGPHLGEESIHWVTSRLLDAGSYLDPAVFRSCTPSPEFALRFTGPEGIIVAQFGYECREVQFFDGEGEIIDAGYLDPVSDEFQRFFEDLFDLEDRG